MKVTPAEVMKNNFLQIKQRRRSSRLKEVTEQNLKMFYRIKAQKSEYKFEKLHKQFSSECKVAQKSRYEKSIEPI